VLCAAPDRRRLVEIKRAVTGAEWELVGGAVSAGELLEQVAGYGPHVVVLDADLGPGMVDRVRAASEGIRVVAVGHAAGADQEVAALEDLRDAVLGLPRPGGPVRR
jgi:hypothetical protein